MIYQIYESQLGRLESLYNLLDYNDYFLNLYNFSSYNKNIKISRDILRNIHKRRKKPAFNIKCVNGGEELIHEKVVIHNTFCDLLEFKYNNNSSKPIVLVVAPLSGHYSTLLRGTVKALLSKFQVFITDWHNIRDVHRSFGNFDLNSYIDVIIKFLKYLGKDTHVISVCQPGPLVLSAIAVMAENNEVEVPKSLTLMGAPIDTRYNPTKVNKLAKSKSIKWFKSNMISSVPLEYKGCGRKVYPGFIQLFSFMSMNMGKHITAHIELYNNLLSNNKKEVLLHNTFYDEYFSVMDLSADFYLQTISSIFKNNDLPKGLLKYKSININLNAIDKTSLMTIEGELDDITGVGQTYAAQKLCGNIPSSKRNHLFQRKVGHYGLFNGSKWRKEIMPAIEEFILNQT